MVKNLGTAKMVVELPNDGKISVRHGSTGGLLYVGKASIGSWNHIVNSIIQSTTHGRGPMVSGR